VSADAHLRQEWSDLLERRPTFRDTLAPYEGILRAWSSWPAEVVTPLVWTAEECRARWTRGAPLLAEASPAVPREAMEELLAPALAFLAAVGTDSAALQRVAEAWDRGEITSSDFLPRKGRLGSLALQQELGLADGTQAFLAAASLRPILAAFFAACRSHPIDAWDLGVCPFCGAPPGFADLTEEGRCILACHVCGGGWAFGRLRCPFCGNRMPQDLVRLVPEDPKEEGYFVEACKLCRGYVKTLDRRIRWNAGSALIEDWGSPHLDLISHQRGYWRPVPSIVQLREQA
jgi:hypothetical protein